MSQGDLLDVYRAYLHCLNERQWPRLGEFVADRLSYNGKHITVADYRTMLEGDVDAVPDLQYQAKVLIAAGDVVACRLLFECTPRRTFLGFEPTGGQVSFPEHVFYRFDDDRRIAEVWSVIDMQAIREQVSRGW
jgi:predicted ester cyclase